MSGASGLTRRQAVMTIFAAGASSTAPATAGSVRSVEAALRDLEAAMEGEGWTDIEWRISVRTRFGGFVVLDCDGQSALRKRA